MLRPMQKRNPIQMSIRSKSLLATYLIGSASLAAGAPCDIYAAGETPCVAAHSTTRNLFDHYDGPLYRLIRAKGDGDRLDIYAVEGGKSRHNGSNADKFCRDTWCFILKIYDQTGNGNDLFIAPPGRAASGANIAGFDMPAHAFTAQVELGGKKVNGLHVVPGVGYRNDRTKGIATGDEPEGMYAVLDGTHYNDKCCFDYGNAETNNRDTGNGHMETINFGTGDSTGNGLGKGKGPWVMADLENGLFSGSQRHINLGDLSVKHRFVTAIVKGKPNHWALRVGDAAKGHLATYYDGARPDYPGYNPMQKEGAIVLGIGGDNSNRGEGTFYEGAITRGYPSAKTEDAVQADIVAAGYRILKTQPTPLNQTKASEDRIRPPPPFESIRPYEWLCNNPNERKWDPQCERMEPRHSRSFVN